MYPNRGFRKAVYTSIEWLWNIPMKLIRYIAALLFCLTAPLFAQFETSTVLGTLADASGALIPAAKVSLTNVNTGQSFQRLTDDKGNFEFFNVKVGLYELTAEASGFQSAKVERIQVGVNVRQRVDITLQVGQVSETVEVSGVALTLETDTSARGQSVQQKQIVELPLNGRQYSNLVLLTTGVRASALSTGGFTPREGSFNVNGLRSTFNNFLLDGMDNNAYGTSNQGFSNQVMQPPPDAVAEFQVVTNNMSAEFGRTGGAAINVAYKSGTNDFHGSVWHFLRNRSLNATGFFRPVNNEKPPFNRNQFGATFGGPIRKNRAFFFLDYEGFRQVRRVVSLSTLPTMAERQGIFPAPVRNPITGQTFAAGTPIPVSQITPFAARVLSELPAPNLPGAANNFSLLQGFRDNTDKYNAKFDYTLSDKLSGFTRIGQRKANIFDEPNIPGPSGGDGNGYTDVINQQVATAMTWAPTATQLLEFRFGVSRTIAGKAPPGLGANTMQDVYGIPGLPSDPRVAGGLTTQIITGYTTLGRQATNPQWQYPTMWNPKVNWSRFLGSHSLKAGYEYQRVHTEIQDVNPLYGEDRYNGQFSRPVGAAAANFYNLADFMFGLRDRLRLTNLLIANYRQAQHFLYLQDDWRLSRKLTLNLGVRYEYATPQWERDNILTNFDPARNALVQATDGSVANRAQINPDRNNFAPRVGLAYSLDNKTVIRSGFGLNYIHFHRAGGGNILAINGPQVVNAVVNQTPVLANGQPNPAFLTTAQGYPNGLTAPSTFNPLLANITYMPRDWRTSYVLSWFFSVQRELARNTILDVAYVGNRANGLLYFADFNQARALTDAEFALPAAQRPSLQARRPIQGFSDITYAFPGGWSNYNSLQVRLERRYSSLFVLNSFTWSKALDNGSGALEGPNGNASAPQNLYNLAAEKGPSAYNQTLTNITTITYELPFGKGRKWMGNAGGLTNAVLGGWNLSTINNWWSGATINMFYTPASAVQVSTIGPDWRGAPRYRPNVSGDPLLPAERRTGIFYLNPATVTLPAGASPFGNAGRNIARMPVFFQNDLAISKDFALPREDWKLQFRTEVFNFTNKTNFFSVQSNRNSPAFGQFVNTFDPRLVQFALRLQF